MPITNEFLCIFVSHYPLVELTPQSFKISFPSARGGPSLCLAVVLDCQPEILGYWRCCNWRPTNTFHSTYFYSYTPYFILYPVHFATLFPTSKWSFYQQWGSMGLTSIFFFFPFELIWTRPMSFTQIVKCTYKIFFLNSSIHILV